MNGLYRFHPHGEPIPFGWRYESELEGNHRFYAFLIKRDLWGAVREWVRRWW